jgi:hypothetical protein
MLATLEIKVAGLRSEVNERIARELTKIYRRVFYSKQDFLERQDLYPNTAETEVVQLGAFISGIAKIALLNNSLGLSSDVSITANETENGVALTLNKPSDSPEGLKISPLNVQLTESGFSVLPGASAKQ